MLHMPRRVRRLLNGPGALGMPPAAKPGPGAQQRLFSSSRPCRTPEDEGNDVPEGAKPRLTHVSESGTAHMVSIATKPTTSRIATAACTVRFSSPEPLRLIRANQLKKGDVLGVARVAGIMAAKRTSDLIPLCHPIALSKVSVELEAAGDGMGVEVRATVTCEGRTGVEMEAMTAAGTAALTVYDMCKAVDRGMVVEGLRVVLKDGGKSGRWEMD